MATLVFFHAHPDDECIATGGTMSLASAAGHRVVLVTATGGEHGEVAEGYLADGETLGERRARELEEAARILGVHRAETLGYVDSGMMGTATNDAPESFWQADVEQAARRLAAILSEEQADVVTVYDDHGGYGHPDHIQVHRVGVRAAELAGVDRVYEATMNRDAIRELMAQSPPDGDGGVPEPNVEIEDDFGSPAEIITTAVDVRAALDVKRKAMQAHGSQIAETSFFLAMPPELFGEVFGTEWYIRRGAAPGTRESSLLEGLT